MTRRLIAIGVALLAAGIVVVLGTGAGDDQKGVYKVRAIFSNAFTVIPGEDVKISGVKVGKISALDVTPDNKAAVVLDITEPGFKDFRKDATCTIRPQSLIGERYVECTPTQPRAEGDASAPKLAKIQSGAGKGEYLLPDSQTLKPVDLDLVGNIMRLPYRERLSIIINELGTGLAANGDELRQAVREANPALEQTDKVLAILAEQNRTLAELAKNGDEVLRPLARDKAKVADFIVKANTTAQASAQRRTDIEANLAKLPGFLKELKPTMQRLGGLADQMTPVLTDLNAAAPEINTFIKQLGPFSEAGTPALTSLGDAADVGDQALLKSKPVVGDLKTFANDAKPTVDNLEKLLTSLKETGGIERLMDFLYFQAAATNGYDSLGHYLRAVFVLTTCTTYSVKPLTGCTANFPKPVAAEAASARAAKSGTTTPTVASVNREIADGRSPFLARQDAVANGLDPAAFDQQDAAGSSSGKDGTSSKTSKSSPSNAKIDLPASLFPGAPAPSAPASSSSGAATSSTPASSGGAATTPSAPAPSSAAPSTTTQPAQPSSGATQTLLDYLLGG
ncbi:MAG TPA: MlaD family protein [Baekduia sp.]|uniref:MlaD family protein n=1 Tax=Baekduia sp. TaxID=2600305 RepID=UPI002C2BAB7E|nr:MlaD family protein [Baekduia sp.]HMJ36806.1 MlaD family protein [Baekduia sp.]